LAALVLSMLVAAAEVQENPEHPVASEGVQEKRESTRLPSFQELEAAGAVIGEIRINTRNIFDLDDPRENNALFRFANKVHIVTREGVVRRTLLFKPGEPLSARLIEETERLLRANSYLYDVLIRPAAWHDGIVDIEVTTRDTWTLHPAMNFSRQGGTNTGGLGLKESNLLGTGIAVGLGKIVETERSGTEFSIAQNHAFDGWTTIEYRHGKFTDGGNSSFRLDRPFYALDTRWAAGLSVATTSQIDSVFSGSALVGQYRHASDRREIYGGWSAGLSSGWTHRYSVGLQYQDDAYSADPSLPAPPEIPADLKLVSPFLRYEVVEDDFVKVKDRNKIERVEYFELGVRSLLQLGRATTGLGSTRDLWLYNAAVSDGFALSRDDNLLLSAYANGRYGSGSSEPQLLGVAGKYYNQQRGNKLFFTSLTWDSLSNGTGAQQLQLGGDTGLRGYPLHYQTGEYRALLSLEQRVYTDWFPFRLFRVGGAAFLDYGRAWGGPNTNTSDPGWLSDIGIGLRILNDRSSRGDVLHIDLAFPIHPAPGVRPYQFLIKTRRDF
jgi:outer membrane protein assembly factor BamA